MNIHARVIIYRDSSCNKWAAQCLEYDIAAQGDSLQEVSNRFERTFVSNIVLALQSDEIPLQSFLPAPHKFTAMWNEALALGEAMSLTVPSDDLPENVLPFPDRVPRGEALLRIAA